MHYGLLPRANRGIFAHQRAARSRRQDPGRPVQHHAGRRRPDQRLSGPPAARRAARSSPRTPRTTRRAARSSRRSRIASAAEIRTHYPATRRARHAITRQEAWTDARRPAGARFPTSSREVVERDRLRGARRPARSTSAPACRSACRSPCSRTSSRTPSGARSLSGETRRRAAHHRRLRGAAGDHRQDRARVRGRAGRRRRRSRAS